MSNFNTIKTQILKYNFQIYNDTKLNLNCNLGIGDILYKIIFLQKNDNNNKLVYFPIDAFKKGLCKVASKDQIDVWFTNPENHLIFRLELINDIFNHHLFLNKSNFIFVSHNKNYNLISDINQSFEYNNIREHKLLLSSSFYNIEIPYSNYIIFHTKCRFGSNFDYKKLKYILNIFFSNITINPNYTIILLGEKQFTQTTESKLHGITTIYNELLNLKKNNNIIDLTEDDIYNSLNYERYKKDICLINKALFNVVFGLGGHLCSSIAFGKVVFYDDLLIEDFNNNPWLFKSGHRYFSKLNHILEYLDIFLGEDENKKELYEKIYEKHIFTNFFINSYKNNIINKQKYKLDMGLGVKIKI